MGGVQGCSSKPKEKLSGGCIGWRAELVKRKFWVASKNAREVFGGPLHQATGGFEKLGNQQTVLDGTPTPSCPGPVDTGPKKNEGSIRKTFLRGRVGGNGLLFAQKLTGRQEALRDGRKKTGGVACFLTIPNGP